MITIIITACREPKTITKAILRVADNKLPNSEILVVAPDKETLNEANKIKTRVKNLRIIKDSGEGKPQALNLAVSKSKGGIIVFTDGDVFVGKNAIRCLISHFKNKKVGAVTGKPVSINPKENKYGYWAYLLTTIAHLRRKKAMLKGKRFFCSGYLFAIRKELFPQLPSELLSEDGYISHFVYTKGYEIAY
ncbi:glycosyltransferase family 2 protein, partial [Candidatus Pacearchaeota archaeon]